MRLVSTSAPPALTLRSTNCAGGDASAELRRGRTGRRRCRPGAGRSRGRSRLVGGPEPLLLRAEDVDRRVLDRAADAARVAHRVVALRVGDTRARVRRHGDVELGVLGDLRVDVAVHAAEHVAHLRRQPHDAGADVPLARVAEVGQQQVVVEELRRRAVGVRERARRQQALVEARVGVRHPLLGERAAGAAGPDRVAQRAEALDGELLGHDHRLGLHGDVAVVPAVVQRGRHHDPAAAQRPVGGRRAGGRRADPVWWSTPHDAPWVISILWPNCGCGLAGVHGLPGW